VLIRCDVTGEKSSLAARSGSGERVRGAVEPMLDGFAICSVARGENGRIVEFSCESVYDAACRLSGLTRERTRLSTLPES
jgi:hypothetical protein